ncbi:MAG: acyltransferase [Bacteroidota bacterium]
MNNSPVKLSYIPGLDGIRALAAFLVILAHWPNYLLSLKFAWMGVNIFFVLSGFLITRILLFEKSNTFKSYISGFYYKRTLRIFPLYYGYLLITCLLITFFTYYNKQLLNYAAWHDAYYAIKNNFIYYLTYTYNFKVSVRSLPDYSGRFFGHLWTLSLEEQFYVVFPFVVYFSSLKTLKIIIITVLFLCPLLRLWGVLYGVNLVTDRYWFGELFYTNTICQSDALITGAALAVFNIKLVKPYFTFFVTFSIWLFVGIVCFIFIRESGYFLMSGKSLGYDFPAFWFTEKTKYWFINIRPFYQYTLVNLLAAALILPAINGQTLFPRIFQQRVVTYLGKISYGIYIFHFPLAAIFVLVADIYLGGWGNLTKQPAAEIICFILYIFSVIGIAHLSYQYFEKKILKYKHNITTP